MGILTAGGAAGQLVFLPVVAVVSDRVGWEVASLVIAAAALAVVPLALTFLRDHPHERGVAAYGDATPYGDVTAVETEPAIVLFRAEPFVRGRHHLADRGERPDRLEADLQRAIRGNELVLHYQPVVRTVASHVESAFPTDGARPATSTGAVWTFPPQEGQDLTFPS